MFRSRWQIHGLLETLGPLHVGTGDHDDHAERAKGEPFVGRVRHDAAGRPYVPATALKGVLRAWMVRRGVDASRVSSIFGTIDADDASSAGGRMTFFDAVLERASADLQERTGVAINRRTGSAEAAEGMLFTKEFVPQGAHFAVSLGAIGADEGDIVALLQALDGFNAPVDSVRLGAGTRGAQGRMRWTLCGIDRLDAAGIIDWVSRAATGAKGEKPVGFAGMRALAPADFARLEQAAAVAPSVRQLCLALDVTLRFTTPFLVRDPKRSAPADDPKSTHMACVDAAGHPVLPSSSARGALRSHAERILRTLNPQAALPIAARRAAIESPDEANAKLCLADRIFGATGWATPAEISDFTVAADHPQPTPFHQQCVAVDRITGGAAHKKLFSLRGFDEPVLDGTIRLDLERLSPEGLGLWALLLRDLIEGDVVFGAGGRRGLGRCHATIAARFEGSAARGQWLRESLGRAGCTAGGAGPSTVPPFTSERLQGEIQSFIKSLRAACLVP